MVFTILALDQALALRLNNLAGHISWLDWLFRVIAIGFVYLIPVVLILLWYYGPKEKVVVLRVAVFGLIGWLGVNNLIGGLWFRSRPFTWLTGTQELIFHQPDKSFPSDHATLGFALAIGLILAGYRRLGMFLFFLTLVVSVARVIVGLHFPLDMVAGLVVGVMMAAAGHWLRKPFDRYVGQPIVRLAKIVRLT